MMHGTINITFPNIVISYTEALHVKFSFTFIYCRVARNSNTICHYNLSVAYNNSKWSVWNKSQYYILYRRQWRALDTIQTSNSLTVEHNRLHLLCTPKGRRGSALTDCKLKLDTSNGVCAHNTRASRDKQQVPQLWLFIHESFTTLSICLIIWYRTLRRQVNNELESMRKETSRGTEGNQYGIQSEWLRFELGPGTCRRLTNPLQCYVFDISKQLKQSALIQVSYRVIVPTRSAELQCHLLTKPWRSPQQPGKIFISKNKLKS